MQTDAAEAIAKQRGWSLVRRFNDDGISAAVKRGRSKRRPAFEALLDGAKRGDFDIVIAYKLDRIFRSTRELLETLDHFEACGVKFVSCTEPIDTTSPIGKVITTIIAALAQFERDQLAERTRDGVAAARRRGKVLGRPKRSVDRLAALELLRRGMKPTHVAKKLGVPRATLYRALGDELKRA